MNTVVMLGVVLLSGFIGFVFAVFVLPLLKKKKNTFYPVRSAELTAISENSLRDPITGLYNKNHLVQRLKESMSRADRDKKKIAIILWDIDGFVSFNNQFGKKAGDKFLEVVASIIRKSLRAYDEAFRSGPDEFCAILSPCDDEIANDVTGRVSQSVSKSLFENEGEYSGKQFSISSGVIFYPGQGDVPEALLHAAREDMYSKSPKAKKTLA